VNVAGSNRVTLRGRRAQGAGRRAQRLRLDPPETTQVGLAVRALMMYVHAFGYAAWDEAAPAETPANISQNS